MKKFYSVSLSIILLVFLSACQLGAEKERTFYYEEGDYLHSTEVFTYKGDKLLHQTGEHYTSYDYLGIADDEEAKELVAEFENDMPAFDGITFTYEYKGDHLIEHIDIEVTKLTPESYEYLYEDTITKKELRYLSMDETAKNILAEGYVEITEDVEE